MNTSSHIEPSDPGHNDTPGTYYLHSRPEVLDRIPVTACRILDVGCGGGGLSAAIKARQPAQVHGVEIVEKAAEHARAHLDRLWNCSVEDALPSIPNKNYDCIVIADVLEHLRDPVDVLRQLKEKLTADGVLVSSIPNVQNWDVVSDLIKGNWDYRSEGILDRTHLRFFTRKSTEELFWNAGFSISDLATTRRGTSVPRALLESLDANGFSSKSLERDGETFQFLITASPADCSRTPEVAIVILNSNGKDDTLECLSSVFASDYPNYHVIVVDNNSSDDSFEAIKIRFPRARILQSGANRGYAEGNNVGIAHALKEGCEYVFLLNNDTTIAPTCIEELVRADQISNSGILGPTNHFFDEPEKIWTIGAKRQGLPNPGYSMLGEGDSPENWPYLLTLDAIAGGAILIRRDVLSTVGMLDERFSPYWDALDFSARSIKTGFRCLYVPRARILKKSDSRLGGPTSPLRTYFNERSKLLWAEKNGERVEAKALRKELAHKIKGSIIPRLTISKTSQPLHKRLLWSLNSWKNSIKNKATNRDNIARILAGRDYFLRRFNDHPETLKTKP